MTHLTGFARLNSDGLKFGPVDQCEKKQEDHYSAVTSARNGSYWPRFKEVFIIHG